MFALKSDTLKLKKKKRLCSWERIRLSRRVAYVSLNYKQIKIMIDNALIILYKQLAHLQHCNGMKQDTFTRGC